MKKHITLLVLALMVLSSCASVARYNQVAYNQRYQDGIYYRPTSGTLVVTETVSNDVDRLIAQTNESVYYVVGDNAVDTLVIPGNAAANFRFDNGLSGVTVNIYTNPWSAPWSYSRYYSDYWYWDSWYYRPYSWYRRPYSYYSLYWDSFYWDRFYWDSWYWSDWYFDTWYHPWNYYGYYGSRWGSYWGGYWDGYYGRHYGHYGYPYGYYGYYSHAGYWGGRPHGWYNG